MPKFHVTLMKEVWEKATVVVEAADETAAENAAIALADARCHVDPDCLAIDYTGVSPAPECSIPTAGCDHQECLREVLFFGGCARFRNLTL